MYKSQHLTVPDTSVVAHLLSVHNRLGLRINIQSIAKPRSDFADRHVTDRQSLHVWSVANRYSAFGIVGITAVPYISSTQDRSGQVAAA